MLKYRVSVQANNCPEIMERILRVVRHRGFRLDSLEMERQDNTVIVNMIVRSERADNLLTLQLSKLFDVQTVSAEAA